MKQAKQQSQDLHRTGDFFTTLLNLETGEEPPKPSDTHPADDRKLNGILPGAHLDPVSPFSQPPAPPPQQPLPEKPDAARSIAFDTKVQTSLNRVDTDKPKPAMNSPSRVEPPTSQILSLVEALTTAKREIDSQGDRVKQLEIMLSRERKAREGAEERARRLLAGYTPEFDIPESESVEGEALDTLTQPQITDEHRQSNCNMRDVKDQPKTLASTSAALETPDEFHHDTASVDASTTRLQEKLDLMIREMDEMKIVMENYKRRAETAEDERKGLAEMVQQIRSNVAATANDLSDDSTILGSSSSQSSDGIISWGSSSTYAASGTSSSSPISQQKSKQLNGRTVTGVPLSSVAQAEYDNMAELERTVSTALQEASKSQRWGRNSRGWSGNGESAMMQGAPYASMVGVVLIGVGIMTWLNGWQRGER